MRIWWRRRTWRPLIRQRQWLRRQRLSPPGEWARTPRKRKKGGAYSSGNDFLYDTTDGDWRQFYDLVAEAGHQ